MIVDVSICISTVDTSTHLIFSNLPLDTFYKLAILEL